ncbi:MAG: dihydrofolate reductase family protein [Burkholderiales bacterium]|nr:dihydrofolate reductase family protein [Burkholderiales bacterium]
MAGILINDGPDRALGLARESAEARDIRMAGGADVIQQSLDLGVVDELEVALAPVLFGGGRVHWHHALAVFLRHAPRSGGAEVNAGSGPAE